MCVLPLYFALQGHCTYKCFTLIASQIEQNTHRGKHKKQNQYSIPAFDMLTKKLPILTVVIPKLSHQTTRMVHRHVINIMLILKNIG